MLRIRGHTLLCLQGFRGEGYSKPFVANMKRIHETLSDDFQTEVEVVIGPDDICSACPYLEGDGCTLNGADAERDMVRKDHHVIELLGINSGSRYRWGDILSRISQIVDPGIVKDLCSKCQWYSLGYCEEGIRSGSRQP